MKEFLTHESPYFQPGTVWTSCDGAGRENTILSVEKFGDGKYDYYVHYGHPSEAQKYRKDIWHFQVRYEPKI